MSDPTFVTGFGQYYYICDRDPTASEPFCYLNLSNFKYMWFNTVSGNYFWCIDNTTNAMVWQKVVTSANLASMIGMSNWKINTSRSYSLRSSPAFNTDYTPSATNDTLVVAIVNCTSTLVTPGTVLFQVNTGSGYVTIGEASVSGVVSSIFQTISAIVPVNSPYKLLNSSGTCTIVLINEISL